jgi:uncharacterized protein (TIGR02594 family)|tara:strand:- start:555 stop:995 length:441 start_codon:yes stop_codon:yes gene_type:complete
MKNTKLNTSILNIALGQYGIKEIRGEAHNPEVIKYFNESGFDGEKLGDETAWCSAFVNWCAREAGLEHTGKLNARSWLTVGKVTTSPQPGDVVVLWRSSVDSWKGHVGFFIKETEDQVYMLGGNQGNQVQIAPYAKNRVLNYIKLS